MDPSFGARLRAQRERQQIPLSAISEDTKIRLSILEGLERDDVSQWPDGIFRRAYVRSYAHAIGLDPEAVVREFLEVHPEPVARPPETETELENPPWPSGFRRLVSSAMAAVPSRRSERARPEGVQPRLDLSRAVEEPHVVASELPCESLLQCEVDDRPEADDRGPEPPPCDTAGDAPDRRERQPEQILVSAAELCTRLGRVIDRREVTSILRDAAAAVDAVGLIVWCWDSGKGVLRPSLAHGYTDSVLARISEVRADADNAIAAAFQSACTSVVSGGSGMTGALVVPLMAQSGCVGVLALELREGDEQREYIQAFAKILAAQLVTLVGSVSLAEAVNA